MKPFFTLLLAVGLTCNLFSQQISGNVRDAETGLPIENVNVYTANNDEGTFTDKNGNFELKLKNHLKPDELIYFTHVSYTPQQLAFKVLKEAGFLVNLIPDTIPLNEVNLVSKRKLQSQLKVKTLPSMDKGIYAGDAVLANNKIYVFGGDATRKIDALKKVSNEYPSASFGEAIQRANWLSLYNYEGYVNTLQFYDLESGKWKEQKTKLPKRAYHDMLYNKNEDQVYVLGGKRLSPNRKFEYLMDEIDILDLKNDTILKDKTNPHQAINFASFVSGDNIILMGGSVKQTRNGDKVYSDKVHLFNTKTGLWYELGNMPQAKETSGVLVNNVIYLIGGSNGQPLTYIETYDLESGKWARIGELFEPLAEPAIAANEDFVYIYYPGNLSVYNTRTGIINKYGINFFVQNPKMFYSENKLYLLGGYDKDEYSVEPSARMISVNLNELNKTRIRQSKIIGNTI